MKTSPVRLIQSISLVATCSSLKYVSLAHLRRTVTYHLQLSDVAFQRHVLVQALILIDFLLTLTEAAKDKKHYKEAQPNLQYKFTLREEDVSQCPPPPLHLARETAKLARAYSHSTGTDQKKAIMLPGLRM